MLECKFLSLHSSTKINLFELLDEKNKTELPAVFLNKNILYGLGFDKQVEHRILSGFSIRNFKL